MNDKNYNTPPSDVNIVLLGIATVALSGAVALVLSLAEPKKQSDEYIDSVIENHEESIYVPYTSPPTEIHTEPPATNPAGVYRENGDVYCVGAEYAPEEYYMPEDYYILISNSKKPDDAYFYMFGADEENWQEIRNYDFQYSCIVKLEKGWDFSPCNCDAYSLEVFDSYGIENSPFEHGGMFRVGTDVPAGDYIVKVTEEQNSMCHALIYDDIDSIEYDFNSENNLIDNETYENIEVTLKDGDILDLYGCVLDRVFE